MNVENTLGSNGLIQISSDTIKQKICFQKLFGLDETRKQLFGFCQQILSADDSKISNFRFYDIAPTVLLYGPPNTGKTTLCYLIFDQIKKEVDNNINFYSFNVGQMLDPSLGQSSRNMERAFETLKRNCKDGDSAFLLLDEIDSLCMSRSRMQENDGVRRAMTTLMLEFDNLNAGTKLLVFGITNVPRLLDSAFIRRFCLKEPIDSSLSLDDFRAFISYLNKPLNENFSEDKVKELYTLYKDKEFTTGDIKALYKRLFIDLNCVDPNSYGLSDKLAGLFKNGFSTREHLAKATGGIFGV